MNKSKFTPGLWDSNCGMIRVKNKIIAEIKPFDMSGEEAAANDNLILAAPEMYKLWLEKEWCTKVLFVKGNWCPVCGAKKKQGHRKKCKLAAVLRKVGGGKK